MNEKTCNLSYSILGDSYSTYEGWIPENYLSWYGSWEENTKGVEDTWWHKLAKSRNWKLLDNCSYSGSTICTTGYNGVEPEQSFIYRMKHYFNKEAKHKPDLILVEGGINDTFTSPVGELKYADWTEEDLKTSLPAFCHMISYLKENQPQARIICLISFTVSLELETGYIEACEHYGVEYFVFPSGELNNGHPTTKGHACMYDAISIYLNGKEI